MGNDYLNKNFIKFISESILDLKPPQTSLNFLERLINIDVKVDSLAQIIESNQSLAKALSTHIKGLGVKNEIDSIEPLLILMGISNVRNFICSFQNLKILSKTQAKLDLTKKYDLQFGFSLKYALKAEAYALKKKIPYSDVVFAAGYIFDRVYLFLKKSNELTPAFERRYEEHFLNGIKTARIAYEISKSISSVGFSKYIFAASLLHEIGKPVMEIYEKNSSIPYNRFLLLLKKRSFAGNCENQIEKMLYGVTHQEYGAGIIFNSELFKPIEKAILYHQEPYLMKETYPDLHFLTQLIQVSSNLAKNIQKIEKLNDEVLSSWVFEETGEFKVNANILMTAMNTVNNDLL